MNFFEKLQKIDRRWIYLILAISIFLPLAFPFNSRTFTTRPTESLYRMIDSFAPPPDTDPVDHNRAFLMSIMHDASTMPELFPMELAVLRHAFERDIKVFTITWIATAAPLIDLAINTVKEEFATREENPKQIISGVHYVNFGFKIPALYLAMILGMGEDIANAIEIDAEGRQLSSLPAMTNIRNYNEMNLVVEFTGSAPGGAWITYARSRFGTNVAVGVTAVSAADVYPQLQTGQLIGMLAGLKGAAEYEKLVEVFAATDREFSREILRAEMDNPKFALTNDNIPYNFKQARIGMNAQSVAHILIIVFILIGNIGYFVQKYKQKQEVQ
ncbi:MAG: hypothetical protein FWG98_03655 [Candidatus Cloacimonetes bacterium]|nr:hypothetical protein [Candidatus Cloacimonadota bacterium]